MIRFFIAAFFLFCSTVICAQEDAQQPVLDLDYDRCEKYEYGGWGTISVRFQEEGSVMVSLDDYTIKSQFADEQAYQEEVDRISDSDLSIMGKVDANAQMYDNAQMASSGIFSISENSLNISLGSDEILGTNKISCKVEGRLLKCGDLNFVLAEDEVIFNNDVINITNVIHYELTFQEEPVDRWIVRLDTDDSNTTLDNGENFRLESLYNHGQFLAHGRDGEFGLFPDDEVGINYDFRFYDSYGEGPVEALEDLKFKPSYFFGDYSYIVGIDQELDNARISKKFKSQENLWYVESAMCDIVDELATEK